MKSKNNSDLHYQKLQSGFTLIEMLVVIGIISMMTGLFLTNFNSLEGPRNLKIAQNQLVTDVRKIQSYTLSSRNVSTSGLPARYYIIKFDTATPNRYVIQAIDNGPSNLSVDLQTILLPKNIKISSISLQSASGFAPITATCAQVAFALPFGRVFMDNKTGGQTCDIANTFSTTGDLTPYKNFIIDVTLSSSSGSKIVEVNGVSQAVEAK